MPDQGGDFAGGIAHELNSGLDYGRDRSRRTGEEAVPICGIEHPNLAGFIKSDELVRACKLAPHLEIHEGILDCMLRGFGPHGVPLIDAGILTKNLFIDRMHFGMHFRDLKRRVCDHCSQQSRREYRADYHPLTHAFL